MKLSRELILTILVLALLIAVSFFRQKSVPASSSQTEDVKYTSYSAGKQGAKALYLLLKKLDYKPKRLRMPHLTDMRTGGLAIILAPDNPPISEADAGKILDWLRQGNMLLFVPGERGDQLAKSLRVKLSQRQSPGTSISPFALTNLTAGIRRLTVRSGDRIVAEREDAVRHFGDSAGGVIISFREGNGTVIVASDPYLMTNVGLPESDNLKLLVNILLLHTNNAKTVYFDEYNHGFVGRPSVLHLLWDTPLGWALLQVAAAVALLMFSRGRRFGRPKPVLSQEHRSSVEYVTSLAGIYQAAQATDMALSSLYERLLRSTKTSAELVEECKRRMREGEISERELIDLARRMESARHPREGR
jgi:hypothetical protein